MFNPPTARLRVTSQVIFGFSRLLWGGDQGPGKIHIVPWPINWGSGEPSGPKSSAQAELP